MEGYQELRLKDNNIDAILHKENIDTLRIFRNGTFHYQKNANKLIQFFEYGAHDSRLEWAELLHQAFFQFSIDYRMQVTVSNFMAAHRQRDLSN